MTTTCHSIARPATAAAILVCLGASLGGCASEPVLKGASFAPAMMLSGPATLAPAAETNALDHTPADPMHELSRKSMAAKVLASRALESVTGLKADPARLSEHD
jgi:hypothetical protein